MTFFPQNKLHLDCVGWRSHESKWFKPPVRVESVDWEAVIFQTCCRLTSLSRERIINYHMKKKKVIKEEANNEMIAWLCRA